MIPLRTHLLKLAATLPTGARGRKELLSILATEKSALRLEGTPQVIEVLNRLLQREMTVVHQYMVQHSMCDNWGYNELSGCLKAQAIGEMKHAEMLIERIIFLESAPEVGQLGEVRVGADIPTMLQNNEEAEREAVELYNRSIAICYQLGDNGTRKMLEPILSDEEAHLDHTQALLDQINAMGLELFLSEQTTHTA